MVVSMSANVAGKGETLTTEERYAVRHLARDLADSFSWGLSPQGYTYWSTVYRCLLRLADGRQEAEAEE